MSTRYGDRGFGRYGDSDEDRTEDYEREGERGYGLYGARAVREDYDTRARDYSRGRGEYGRDYSARDYGQRDYGSRDYSSPYGASRYGREGGAGGYAGGRRYAGEDYGRDPRDPRDYAARDYTTRGYGRGYGREEGRGYRRDAGDERDEVRSFDTDYGRTTSRFYGSSGYEYGRDDYDERDERGAYGGREYGRRDERRDEGHGGGLRGWWDRAADGVLSWFGEEGGGRRRGDDSPGRRGEGGFRGRGPRNYRRTDERIREDVSERLSDNDWLDASDVEVNVVAGEVILTGTVDSRYAKRLAEEICESASGVNNVQNNLRVRSRQAADFDSNVTTGAAAATGGMTGPLGDAPLTTAAHDITATADPGATATTDAPDTPPTGRSSRAAGRS